MLIEHFIRAVKAFRNRPAMLRQALKDAELYYKEGELSSTDLTILKNLARM